MDAIVKKFEPKPNSPYSGTVDPLIVEKQGEFPQLADREDFPNEGKIFIANDYDRCNSRFDEGELFRLYNVRANNNSSVDPLSPHYCGYMAYGADTKELSRDEYFHLVNEDIADDNVPITVSLVYKPNRYIMLASATHYYGPFDYDEPDRKSESGLYDIKLKAWERLPGFPPPNCSVLKVPKQDFQCLDTGKEIIFIADTEDLRATAYEEVDFISNEQLIRWGNDRLSSGEKLPKKNLRDFQKAIIQLSDTSQKFAAKRKERLLTLVHSLDIWQEERTNLITEYLATPAGEAQVKSYIESARDTVLASAKKELEKELEVIQEELQSGNAELEKRKQILQGEIGQLEIKKQQTEEQQEQEITQELKQKKQELEDLCVAVGVATDIQSLKINLLSYELVQERVKEKNEGDIKTQEKRLHDLQETQDEIARNIKTKHEDLKRKLAEVARDDKPYLDILNGIIPTLTDDKPNVKREVNERQDGPETARELVDEVCKILKSDFDRDYKFEDVANYLLCIHQNFLTVFAGLPGVGKTSLVTYLAESLGIVNQDLFLKIPTARGMTSQRDILGYYNPLSQRYQPSQTGLYQYLESMKHNGKLFPYWVLLDEANLSPIEHYFSTFLGMCDDYDSKTLITGEPGPDGKLRVPASLRFMATVNYDNTTEPLSPRVIDRVPVVYIEAPEGAMMSDGGNGDKEANKPSRNLLPYTNFEILFASSDGIQEDLFTTDEERILTKVVDDLKSTVDAKKGLPVIVSPRRWKQMRRYCSAARELMKGEEGKGSSLRALDYAVAQHILPLINGNGDKYRRRLDDLRNAITNLDNSSRLLKRIVEVGDEDQRFYRFFC